MRRAACLLLLLLGSLWGLARVEVATPFPAQPAPTSPWRRTRDGWQRSDRWGGAHDLAIDLDTIDKPPNGLPTPTIAPPHPLIWALLEALASAFVLVALSPTKVSASLDCCPAAPAPIQAGRSSPI